jgi:hypothetical protein
VTAAGKSKCLGNMVLCVALATQSLDGIAGGEAEFGSAMKEVLRIGLANQPRLLP